MATIKDVAQRAGVSVSTVSNFLNRKGNIGVKKHERIFLAIEELSYSPNLMARNMKTSNLNFVAFIVPHLDGIYRQVFSGVIAGLEHRGYHILTKLTHDDPFLELKILSDIAELGVTGVVMVPVCPQEPNRYSVLQKKKLPVVFIERQATDLQFSSVAFDNRNSVSRELLPLFAKYGTKNAVLVAGPVGFSSEDDTVEGFRDAYSEFSSDQEKASVDTFVKGRVIRCSMIKEKAFPVLFEALELMDRPPLFFIVTGASAAEALMEVLQLCAWESHVLTLGGLDWFHAAAEASTPKTTRRDSIQLGVTAAAVLLDKLDNRFVSENRRIVIGVSEPVSTFIPTKSQKTKLNVLLLESPSSRALVRLSSGYSRRTGLNVKFELASYLELREKLVTRLSSGDVETDVVMVDIPWANSFVENEVLVDFGPQLMAEQASLDFFPSEIQSAFLRNDGKVFGLPFIATSQFLFYRKDLFENEEIQWKFNRHSGMELVPPRNWTEFNIVAEFFNRRSNTASPVEFGTSLNALHPVGIVDEFLPRQWAFNGRFFDKKGNPAVLSGENLLALENLCRTFSLVSEDCLDSWWDDEFRKLIEGSLGMVVGFASHFPGPATAIASSPHYGDIAVSAIPGASPMLGGWTLGINKASRSVEDAYRFIRWATGDHHSIHNLLMGGAPPTRSACESSLLKLYVPWMRNLRSTFLSSGVRETYRNTDGHMVDPYWLDTQISLKLLDAMQGRTSPRQALAELNDLLVQTKRSVGRKLIAKVN